MLPVTLLSDRDLAGIQATLDQLPDVSTVNATILELRGPGTMDEYGQVDDADTGTVHWDGEAGAHLRRARDLELGARTSSVSSAGGTVAEHDELVVLRRVLPDAVLVAAGSEGVGWTVLFRDLRPTVPVERRARVSGVTSEGDGALADKVVLQLEAESAGA